MLHLRSATPPEWVRQVEDHLEEVLIDHAHCEKKAAGTAMNLIFAFVDETDFVGPLSEIVQEELEHYRQVLDILARRGIRFRRLHPSNYGRRLTELARPHEPDRTVDRLLVAALIEARSCERFAVLRDHLHDRELARFYGDLFESEARHHSTYVKFAKRFATADAVHERLADLAELESRILAEPDAVVRVHSGIAFGGPG